MTDGRTVVLGAGLSGLIAAKTLRDAGRDVLVLDKGRGVGGRLATRRIDEAVLDHGAQFFTVRGDEFSSLVTEAQAAGVTDVWCHGFGEADGYPRWFCPAGMTSLAKWLAADLDVRLDTRAWAVAAGQDGAVHFMDEDGRMLAAGADAIISAPIPQMLDLFDNGAVKLGHELASALKAIRYHATLALLVVLDGKPNVDEPGGMQFSDGPFTFIADNRRKGVSPVTALTFHAEHRYSLRRFDDDPDDVHRELLEMAQPWIGAASVVSSQLKKWRYAGPVTPLPQATMTAKVGEATVALCGDAFGGPKVEGAFNSGRAAARALLQP